MLSIRTREPAKKFAVEAFRRAKMKFPGRQNIYESKNWGFTKFRKREHVSMRKEGRVIPDGNNCKYVSGHGPLLTASGETIECLDTLPEDDPDFKRFLESKQKEEESSSDES